MRKVSFVSLVFVMAMVVTVLTWPNIFPTGSAIHNPDTALGKGIGTPASEIGNEDPLAIELFMDDFEDVERFEKSWQTEGHVSLKRTASYEGEYGAKLKKTGAKMWVKVDVDGPGIVTVSYWNKTKGMKEKAYVEVFYRFYNRASEGKWRRLEKANNKEWTHKTFDIIMPGNKSGVEFAVSISGDRGKAFLDNFLVTKCPSTEEVSASTLIIVRNNHEGYAEQQPVRKDRYLPDGKSLSQPQKLPFPKLTDWNLAAIHAPSAIVDTQSSQVLVARAFVDGETTSIQLIRSGYAAKLSNAPVRDIVQRQSIIDSAVHISHLNGKLVILWKEGSSLMYVSSSDSGRKWSGVMTIPIVIGVGREYAVVECDEDILLVNASGNTGLQVGRITSSNNGVYYEFLGLIKHKRGEVVDISVVVDQNSLFVAYALPKQIRVTKWPDMDPYSAITNVVQRTIHRFESVTIYRSPIRWEMLYTLSRIIEDNINPMQTISSHTLVECVSRDGLIYSISKRRWDLRHLRDRFVGAVCLYPSDPPWPCVVQIHHSGQGRSAVYNFLIVAEGYTFEERDDFRCAAYILKENIRSRSPFYYNQDNFNVYAVYTYSREQYYDDPIDGGCDDSWGDRDTFFNSYRNGPCSWQGAVDVYSPDFPIDSAKLMLHGDGDTPTLNYGFYVANSPEDRPVKVAPRDTGGVPLGYDKAHSVTPIHEYMHTIAGGFHVGDHDLHFQHQNSNKSFDGRLDPGASPPHDWQDWFVFDGPAPSPLIEVTDDYRADPTPWLEDPYSGDPSSPSYVNALTHFNPGLWESINPDADWDWYGETRQYSILLNCGMNSRYYKGEVFCPICSEIIVRRFWEERGGVFDRREFQQHPGAYLEFPLTNPNTCEINSPYSPPDSELDLSALIEVNGTIVEDSEFEIYEVCGVRIGVHVTYTRVNITPYVRPGEPATVVFHSRDASDPATRLWIPGIHVMNGRGARYPMHPEGEHTIETLASKNYDSECEYQYWRLTDDLEGDGDFRIVFVPN